MLSNGVKRRRKGRVMMRRRRDLVEIDGCLVDSHIKQHEDYLSRTLHRAIRGIADKELLGSDDSARKEINVH